MIYLYSNIWPSPKSRQQSSSQFYAQQPVPIHGHGPRKESHKQSSGRTSYGLRSHHHHHHHHSHQQRHHPQLHSGSTVHHSGPSVLHSGPSVLHSGPSVLHSGPSVLHSGPSVLHSQALHSGQKKKSSSSSIAARFPSQLSANQLLAQHHDPTSLDLSKDKYRVVQRLLPDIGLAKHIVNSDDHCFSSYDECCGHHDMNNNSTEAHSGIFC